jgi:hypothetical protein
MELPAPMAPPPCLNKPILPGWHVAQCQRAADAAAAQHWLRLALKGREGGPCRSRYIGQGAADAAVPPSSVPAAAVKAPASSAAVLGVAAAPQAPAPPAAPGRGASASGPARAASPLGEPLRSWLGRAESVARRDQLIRKASLQLVFVGCCVQTNSKKKKIAALGRCLRLLGSCPRRLPCT